MYKLSFRTHMPIVKHKGVKTEVTLMGVLLYKGKAIDGNKLPDNVKKWVKEHPFFVPSNVWLIKATGTTTLREGDKLDRVLGERIAESKAKVKLYRFMTMFLHKLEDSYYDELGEKRCPPRSWTSGDSVIRCCNKHANLWARETVHLKKLIGNESNPESTNEP